jgi:hypothetical protein
MFLHIDQLICHIMQETESSANRHLLEVVSVDASESLAALDDASEQQRSVGTAFVADPALLCCC